MTIKELDFVLDILNASISDLESAFEDASPFMPMTEAVQRTVNRLKKAKDAVTAATEHKWDKIIGSQNDDA